MLATAALLTTAGVFLLYAGLHQAAPSANGDRPPASAAPAPAPAPARTWGPTGIPVTGSPSSVSATSRTTREGAEAEPVPRNTAPSPSASVPAPSPTAPLRRELPPPGSGPGADPLIQQVMDEASAPDLPADEERRLLELGRTAWLGETSRYSQVRIQAATARRDPTLASGPGSAGDARQTVRAVVRLVWAGADPAGTFLDGRPAAVHFTQNGNGTWIRT
ncbi:hypothetical protein ACFXB3_23110 [Streptomyces sp. NPDC059447]|uniref:hypothetical protein n=1 Tax=Streptomyces sp. NPDC059447 TaxID=3346834 RepID=UPI0036B963A0